jgi:hypothetical protein
MTEKRIRKGNVHKRQTGRVVRVPDHLHTTRGGVHRDASSVLRKATQAAAGDVVPVVVNSNGSSGGRRGGGGSGRSFGGSRFRQRFDLGIPVELKADELETEIGLVRFTEDLVMGLDDEPSPTSKREARDMILVAAERYALLTAYVAAEKNVSIDNMIGFVDRFHGGTSDPLTVLEAVERLRSNDEADHVIYALDGTAEKDRNIVDLAAVGYSTYIVTNREALIENDDTSQPVEANLKYARSILSDFDPERPTDGYGYWPLNPLGDSEHDDQVFEALMDTVDVETLDRIRSYVTPPSGKPFMEPHPSGFVLHLDGSRSIEVAHRISDVGWCSQVRRVVTRDDQRVVTATEMVGPEDKTLNNILGCAYNFNRPLSPYSNERVMVGFSRRNQMKSS